MAFLQCLRRVSIRTASSLRRYTNTNYPLISSEHLIEEETLPGYQQEHYYPVHIGDVFNSQYKVVGKLGYGVYSTVWLCQDITPQPEHRYAALKVSTCIENADWKSRTEYRAYEHLTTIQFSHPGQTFIRQLYDTFEVDRQYGQHQCLVQPPMHKSIRDIFVAQDGPLDLGIAKGVVRCLLMGLDFLHSEANIIHTDIKADNLMLTLRDESVLEDFEKAEAENPVARKVIDDSRTIYTSRGFGRVKSGKYGYPVLCDLGEAKILPIEKFEALIQPEPYRAPEVIFEIMPWGAPADIWNVGTLVWHLVKGKSLFANYRQEYSPFPHVALMTGVLGPPPASFLERNRETTSCCFEESGQWNRNKIQVPETTLEEIDTQYPQEDKELFFRFVRSMLKWLPEERKTASQLVEDPWLKKAG